ncbi:hypothetical protein TNCV_4636911 [Trichonephila clavipes]|nr:hypothetical protein TNCV_4636911 [Trichonephila clavipes]
MGSPRDEKRRRYNVPSISHGSVTTASLEKGAPTMRRDRPHALRDRQTRDQRNELTEKFRVRNSTVEIEQASSHKHGMELLNSEDLTDCEPLGVSNVQDISRNCQMIYSQFGLAIHQNDHQARCRFVEWAQNEIAVVPDFHKRILFSDEAHFWLNGYVNKQNCRIWSEANPQVYVETPLHPEKLTVWCALWAGGILLQKR